MTGTVLLAGATGYMGSRVARELLEHGYRLVCPVRDASSRPSQALLAAAPDRRVVRLIETELSSLDALHTALRKETVDAVVSCIASRRGGLRDSEIVEYGINRTLLNWSEETGVPRFVLLSAICVQKPRLAFQHAKLRFEQELQASTCSHAIVRPTAFFKSLSGQLPRVRAGKPFLLFGHGELTRCKPIAEADLAAFMRLMLEDQERTGIFPIGGPGPAISPRDQAEILGRLLKTPLRTRSVNPTLLKMVARALDLPGYLSPSVADKAEFARIGHYYATESMLLWDEQQQRYDADATPEFGSISLEDSYRAQLNAGEQQSAGDHAMFR